MHELLLIIICPAGSVCLNTPYHGIDDTPTDNVYPIKTWIILHKMGCPFNGEEKGLEKVMEKDLVVKADTIFNSGQY